MKKTTKNTGIKVTTGVKGGSYPFTNHNQVGLKIVSGLRAGVAMIYRNHNTRLLSLD
jgi:hypothetical protein